MWLTGFLRQNALTSGRKAEKRGRRPATHVSQAGGGHREGQAAGGDPSPGGRQQGPHHRQPRTAGAAPGVSRPAPHGRLPGHKAALCGFGRRERLSQNQRFLESENGEECGRHRHTGWPHDDETETQTRIRVLTSGPHEASSPRVGTVPHSSLFSLLLSRGLDTLSATRQGLQLNEATKLERSICALFWILQ